MSNGTFLATCPFKDCGKDGIEVKVNETPCFVHGTHLEVRIADKCTYCKKEVSEDTLENIGKLATIAFRQEHS